jgi:hypothetical protein
VVLQHVLDRLPGSGEGDGTCVPGGTFVPQLHKPAADIPVLVEDRFGGLGLGAVVVVSHTDQSAGRAVIVLAERSTRHKGDHRVRRFKAKSSR